MKRKHIIILISSILLLFLIIGAIIYNLIYSTRASDSITINDIEIKVKLTEQNVSFREPIVQKEIDIWYNNIHKYYCSDWTGSYDLDLYLIQKEEKKIWALDVQWENIMTSDFDKPDRFKMSGHGIIENAKPIDIIHHITFRDFKLKEK